MKACGLLLEISFKMNQMKKNPKNQKVRILHPRVITCSLPRVDDTLHVFSLASGHLYERFLKIMMWSVVQHTKGPVKFWLLSNFLSADFKVRLFSLNRS